VAGVDGGLGGRRGARKTVRKSGARLSIDASERGEKEGGARGEKRRLHRVRIDDVWRRRLRAPASDLSSPAASFQRGKGGVG
jgi:hypothetical protein